MSVLRTHVRESNEIESITLRSGALVQSHLAAALLVARKLKYELPVHPYKLHRCLGMGTALESHAGRPRTCRVWIGGRECPKPEHVPFLMEWWGGIVQAYVHQGFRSEEAAGIATLLHDFLLCIHPFQDGNGRTARLVLNGLRLRYGLPWRVVEARLRMTYYARIKAIESQIFRKKFPHVY